MGYLMIFGIFVITLNGVNILTYINPDMTPDKWPKNEAWGTSSCMITNSAQGAKRREIEKKPKSSSMFE